MLVANSMKNVPCFQATKRNFRNPALHPGHLIWLFFLFLLCALPAVAQFQLPSTAPGASNEPSEALEIWTSGADQQVTQLLNPQSTGSISGIIVDPSGNLLSGVKVQLAREDQSPTQETLSGDDGQFKFTNLAPGPFLLTISAQGFNTQTPSGVVQYGENFAVPQIVLVLATNLTQVRVELSPIEIAQEQIHEQEKQRVLGFIPNFYVSYVPNAAPLTPKQKFELAWKSTLDPVTLVITGAVAGGEQAVNYYSGYGQGAQGYGKRYGAAYADTVTSTFIGGAILPSLLKQDPRYFYKGTGSTGSRIKYAISRSVLCKGDNGRWQVNYSAIMGSLAAGGISNLYYPASDRNGAALTFENTLIGIGATAAANLVQEFLVRKLSRNLPPFEPPNP